MPACDDMGGSVREHALYEADKKRGRRHGRECPERVEEMQRVIAVLSECYWSPVTMTQLALAEAIALWFARAGLVAPVPPIDRDGKGLERRRKEARERLRALPRLRREWREPTLSELAAEVASRTHASPATAAATRKIRHILKEVGEFEYTFPGTERSTGRFPLPPSR